MKGFMHQLKLCYVRSICFSPTLANSYLPSMYSATLIITNKF